MELRDKIKNREARICVIGLGYIGLPLACFFARAGFKVIGYDLNKELVKKIKTGECPLEEPGFQEIFKQGLENLEAGTSKNACEKADIYVICVNTPVKDKKPKLDYLESAFKTVSEYLKPGNLVVIESTVPPGTTTKLWKKYGKEDCHIAHCPERVMPGKLCTEFLKVDRVIGGLGKEDSALAGLLYEQIIDGNITKTDLTTAEFVKVVENVYRNTNIALANELARIADELEIDVYKAIEIANKHPRVSIHRPGPGVGGNCVPASPVLLKDNSRVNPSIIQKGSEVNEEMPQYLADLVLDNLKKNNIGKDAKIILLGYSYKPDNDGAVETPIKYVYKALADKAGEVLRFDPFIKEVEIKELKEFYENCKGADCLVLGTAHSIFRDLDLEKIKSLMRTPVIVDGCGFFNKREMETFGFKYDGIGI